VKRISAQSEAELVEVIRRRVAELNLSYETIDDVAGLPGRYTNKLLSDRPRKGLGEMSLGAILGAVALRIAPVELRGGPGAVGARPEPPEAPEDARRGGGTGAAAGRQTRRFANVARMGRCSAPESDV